MQSPLPHLKAQAFILGVLSTTLGGIHFRWEIYKKLINHSAWFEITDQKRMKDRRAKSRQEEAYIDEVVRTSKSER